MSNADFDWLIVGAGSAGCVLASRLSESPQRRVLLLEAGADAPCGAEHADVREPYPLSLSNPDLSWPNLVAETGVASANGCPPASRHFLQGRGVGGGSNINGSIAFRGQPGDYDRWRDLGASGWGWSDVLPFFKKLEHDGDCHGPLHGAEGPIPVRRINPKDWAPFSQAVGVALKRRGFAQFADYNGEFSDGLSAIPMSSLPKRRVSASMAYLNDAVRRRPNLTIVPNVFVERLDIRSRQVLGVLAHTDKGPAGFTARETLVSCGGLFSPALLLRSGIGPADTLRALGIEPQNDLPGVGRNLQNHPKVDVAVFLSQPPSRAQDQSVIGQACLRYSSHVAGCDEHDVGIAVVTKASWHPLGARIGALSAALYAPYSRGSVSLASADPQVAPRVSFNLLSDARDFERMVQGLRFALELLAEPEVAKARHEVFFPIGRLVATLSRRTRWNALRSAVILSLLKPAALRRALLEGSVVDPAALARDDSALRQVVRQRTGLSHHVCATCKMGSADDPTAVVDALCRVHGIKGLRVVDASIFPVIPRGGMYIPVLMAAEKMAAAIAAE